MQNAFVCHNPWHCLRIWSVSTFYVIFYGFCFSDFVCFLAVDLNVANLSPNSSPCTLTISQCANAYTQDLCLWNNVHSTAGVCVPTHDMNRKSLAILVGGAKRHESQCQEIQKLSSQLTLMTVYIDRVALILSMWYYSSFRNYTKH